MSDPVSASIAIVAGSAVLNGIGAIDQENMAEDAQSYREQAIRDQQVNLRLQATESAIQRDENLRNVLANSIVKQSIRNIAPTSGSIRAVFNTDFKRFDEDNEAADLNLQYKLSNLEIEKAIGQINTDSQIDNAWLGAATNTFQAYESATLGGFKTPASSAASSGVNDELGQDIDSNTDSYVENYRKIQNPFDINAT